MDDSAALRPLDEAAEDIRRLDDYATPDELAAALQAVAAAVERALRIRLRRDPTTPENERLNAFAPERLTLDDVVRSLRSRDVISLEAAGAVHHIRTAADRAREGDARADDADTTRNGVARLRAELATPAPAVEPAGATRVEGATLDEPGEVPAAGPEARPPDTSPVTGRWMAWLAAAVAAVALIGVAFVVVRGGGQELDAAERAFRAGRLDSAAVMLEQILDDRPQSVTTMLYLGRIYRRLDRPEEAAAMLRRAVSVDGRDADVRRELGHLFMDLDRPAAAVGQYERALDYAPEEPMNWAALIRALRALEDPRADELLRSAPPDVRAALTDD
ncbi:MAG: tetratricopeptide repeat protein [Gemmatimonadota bacterium]